MIDEFRKAYSRRIVLVTGHSGFQGSWLTIWLNSLGAEVVGVSLPPIGPDALFSAARLDRICRSYWQDIRDDKAVLRIFQETKPDIVFHLAAQALVRPAYQDPAHTFSTNVAGTANVLEAARQTDTVSSLVCVTTDKVYDDRNAERPYREMDPLGGQDPYSASKAAAELVARSYMTALRRIAPPLLLATARGGNVLGGGDWAEDRIIPDVVRAIRANGAIGLRNPDATRPWQHVADLCFGYLLLALRLEQGHPDWGKDRTSFQTCWNFGPEAGDGVTVRELVAVMTNSMRHPDFPLVIKSSPHYESPRLHLDVSKAKIELGWRTLLTWKESVDLTASWYLSYLEDRNSARLLTERQIASYERLIEGHLGIAPGAAS